MKARNWILIALLIIACSIIFFPWFEFLILFLLLIILFSYFHYWSNKAMYGPYLYFDKFPESTIWVNLIIVSKELIKIKDEIFVEISINKHFGKQNLQQNNSKILTEEAGRWYLHFYFKDLKPKTRYYYRIQSSNRILRGGSSFYFTTADIKDETKFIIYGDDQTADFVPILAQFYRAFGRYKSKYLA
jgi:hypothetical protein